MESRTETNNNNSNNNKSNINYDNDSNNDSKTWQNVVFTQHFQAYLWNVFAITRGSPLLWLFDYGLATLWRTVRMINWNIRLVTYGFSQHSALQLAQLIWMLVEMFTA